MRDVAASAGFFARYALCLCLPDAMLTFAARVRIYDAFARRHGAMPFYVRVCAEMRSVRDNAVMRRLIWNAVTDAAHRCAAPRRA